MYDYKQAIQSFTSAITGKTNLIARVKNIILNPKPEWPEIHSEHPNVMNILFGYVIILALIPAIASIIGYGLIGNGDMGYGYRSWQAAFQTGIIQFLTAIIAVFLMAWLIDLMAPSFEAEKNFGRSFQLAAYVYTPVWIAGIILLFPSLSIVIMLAMLYSLYLLFLGLPVLKQAPKDKVAGYVIITFICMIIISLLIPSILEVITGIF